MPSHGLLFVSSGYFPDNAEADLCDPAGRQRRHLAQGRRDEQRLHRLVTSRRWRRPIPSPLVVGDQYYTLMDRGFLTSNDPKTGKEIYGRQRIAVDCGTFSASPWAYNGKIFAISEDGGHVRDAGGSRVQAARPKRARTR